jgi:CspA family cold shock protein
MKSNYFDHGGAYMAEGNVLWFDDERGIGFLETPNGEEIFVHHSSIDMEGFRSLAQGDRVTFTIEETSRGLEAKNVKKMDE